MKYEVYYGEFVGSYESNRANDIIERRIDSIPNLTETDRNLLKYLKLKRTKPVF